MADPLVIPDIPQELKDQLKTNRLNEYRARIYQQEMDIAVATAANDPRLLEQSNKNLEGLLKAYYAVEAMV